MSSGSPSLMTRTQALVTSLVRGTRSSTVTLPPSTGCGSGTYVSDPSWWGKDQAAVLMLVSFVLGLLFARILSSPSADVKGAVSTRNPALMWRPGAAIPA
jgi:hypothetical protein